MGITWTSLGLSVLIALSVTSTIVPPAFAANSSGEVINQINTIRIQSGVAPLVMAPELTASAQSYAAAMANGKFFSHVGADGSTMVSRDTAAGYSNWTDLEENLAAGQSTVSTVVSAWMSSPGHRANLLSPQVTETGIGYVDVPGSPFGFYWVEEFGSRSALAVTRPVAVVPVIGITPTATPPPKASVAPAAGSPTPAVSPVPSAPIVLDEANSPPIATPMTNTGADESHAAMLAATPPTKMTPRVQRDQDNLNLFLQVYRYLGQESDGGSA